MLAYRSLKRLILWTPTVTIGLWEYVRHAFLLPHVSMELGNLLAPVIVFIVTVTLVRRLFAKLEETQEALQRERLHKTALVEREQLARELHDGISQSLFLLAVKLDQLDLAEGGDARRETTSRIRETVRRVYDDVRQSIANLKTAPVATDPSWMQAMHRLVSDMTDAGMKVELDWRLSDGQLSAKEKIELLAIIREALHNARKHAQASVVRVSCAPSELTGGFRCRVEDNGIGAAPTLLRASGRYGIRMMESRAAEMGWQLAVESPPSGGMVVDLMKEGGQPVWEN
jgi:nitrate/nitrite-specific signal transduction histidine kinase